MPNKKVGTLKSGRKKERYEVHWNANTNEVSVVNYTLGISGRKYIGKARSISDAINTAESHLSDK